MSLLKDQSVQAGWDQKTGSYIFKIFLILKFNYCRSVSEERAGEKEGETVHRLVFILPSLWGNFT